MIGARKRGGSAFATVSQRARDEDSEEMHREMAPAKQSRAEQKHRAEDQSRGPCGQKGKAPHFITPWMQGGASSSSPAQSRCLETQSAL